MLFLPISKLIRSVLDEVTYNLSLLFGLKLVSVEGLLVAVSEKRSLSRMVSRSDKVSAVQIRLLDKDIT